MRKFDVVVVGGGSGGIGAAWAAAKCGAKTLLVEKNSIIGGTFTAAGVSCWESSASGTGLSEFIYKEVVRYPGASDIYPRLWKTPEYDLSLKTNGLDLHDGVLDPFYATWLLKRTFIKGRYGIIIEPDVYMAVVRRLLEESGMCRIQYNCSLVGVVTEGKAVKSITVETNGTRDEIKAAGYIDSTGGALLADMAGCEMMSGAEGKERYHEPHAPPQPQTDRRNGATLIFRITPHPEKMLKRPEWTFGRGQNRPPLRPWLGRFPNGDWCVNQLPTIKGDELENMTSAEAYSEAVCRTWNLWDELPGKYPAFVDFGIGWIAPELGIREGKRIIGEYVLTENDILDGINNQKYNDVIAVADHRLDMHGVHLQDVQLLKKPYGVPFRSLMPSGWNNLLVACRGAGFSQLASASCRLSRTMLQLGQAAGTAAALAVSKGRSVMDLDYQELRSNLIQQGVVLDQASLEARYRLALKSSGANQLIGLFPT